MNLVVNGERQELPAAVTVADVVARFGPPGARAGVAVAVNGEVVSRRDWSRCLRDGDRVEVLAAIQGGAQWTIR